MPDLGACVASEHRTTPTVRRASTPDESPLTIREKDVRRRGVLAARSSHACRYGCCCFPLRCLNSLEGNVSNMSQARVLAFAVCVACALTSCGDPPSAGPSGSLQPTIDIVGQNGAQAFTPNPAAFGGQSVVFRNRDTVIHRVVFNDGTMDTGDIAPGATSRAVIMPGTGTNYHCLIHASMGGAVSPSSGAPPPPCEGIYCY